MIVQLASQSAAHPEKLKPNYLTFLTAPDSRESTMQCTVYTEVKLVGCFLVQPQNTKEVKPFEHFVAFTQMKV